MFENGSSLSASAESKKKPLRLESLEDRTTPATIGNNIVQSSLFDQAFLSESARLDLVQAYLGQVEASQGSNAQIRAFGQQLAAAQTSAYNQLVPALGAQGTSIQLSSFDMLIGTELTQQNAATIDSQFLSLSTMYSFQSATLDQTGAQFSSNSAVRSFAQAQLMVTQQELLTEIDLLGPTGTSDTLELFELLGGFNATNSVGSPATTGFGAIGSPGTTGFGTLGVGAPSTTATGVGGAGFGTNNGFNTTNPDGTVAGVGGANFGTNANTANTTGSTSSGFGGAGFGTNNGFGAGGTAGF